MASPSLSWSARVAGSMATDTTGSGKCGGSRMIALWSVQMVSPVKVSFSPTAAQMLPAVM